MVADIRQRKTEYYYLAIWMILGAGTLFPYNAIISCGDYFEDLYSNGDGDAKEDNSDGNIESRLAESCTLSLFFVTVILMPFVADVSSFHKNTSTSNRIKFFEILRLPFTRATCGYVLIAVVLFMFGVVSNPTIQLTITLTYLVGVGDAIVQSGLYVLAASCSIRATACVSLGSAMAGFGVNLLRILISKSLDNLHRSTHIFFLISASFICVCLFALFIVRSRADLIKAVLSVNDQVSRTSNTDNDSNNIDNSGNENRRFTKNNDDHGSFSRVDQSVLETNEISERICHEHLEVGKCINIVDDDERKHLWRDYFAVYAETLIVTWKPTLMLFIMFFVTLSLFPGTISEIQSVNSSDSQFVIYLISIFNAFDLVGRLVPSLSWYSQYIPKISDATIYDKKSNIPLGRGICGFEKHIAVPTLFRLVFYPLIIYSNKRTYMRSNMYVFTLMALFGFSNGYVAVLCFMVAPTMPLKQSNKDAASQLMLLACYGGLVAGAVLGTHIHTA